MTSAQRTLPSAGAWRRIQLRSWLPNAVPVTIENTLLLDARHGEVALDPAAAVEHLRVRDRADVAGDAVVAQRSRNSAAPGPATSSFANEDSSNSAARSRVARCSAPIAGDQCIPAQPRGRSDSSPAGAFDSYQFTRSQPDFSPKAASCATCHGVGARGTQRPSRLALVARVADVVVGLVDLLRALRACSAGER